MAAAETIGAILGNWPMAGKERRRLTDAVIARLRTRTRKFTVWDSAVPGLGVRVNVGDSLILAAVLVEDGFTHRPLYVPNPAPLFGAEPGFNEVHRAISVASIKAAAPDGAEGGP